MPEALCLWPRHSHVCSLMSNTQKCLVQPKVTLVSKEVRDMMSIWSRYMNTVVLTGNKQGRIGVYSAWVVDHFKVDLVYRQQRNQRPCTIHHVVVGWAHHLCIELYCVPYVTEHWHTEVDAMHQNL